MKSRIFFIILAGILLLFAGCSAASDNGPEELQSITDDEDYSVSNIYLAGPFFNDTEIANIEYAEKVLTERGFTLFSPMRQTVDAEPGTAEWAEKIFDRDKEEILDADAVVALYYGNNSDSGTAWECGFASALGIPVILVHVEEDGDSNLMMHCGSFTNIFLDDLETYDSNKMPEYEYEGKMY